MRGLGLILILPLLVPVVGAAPASPAPAAGTEGAQGVTGAKDLFYDPSGGGAVPVEVRAAPKPAPAAIPPGRDDRGPAAPEKPGRPRPAAARSLPRHSGNPNVGPVQPAAVKNRGLHYWIELDQPGRYVTNRELFHSGQRIRLHFVSNSDGRILLLQLGASGSSTLLFPDPGKGLSDNRLKAGEDRILPSDAQWFRFDANAGTERLVVLFARDASELKRFPVQRQMGPEATSAVLQTANRLEGSKDLIIETETRTASEVGTYGVNVKGEPVILEISLQHR